MTYEVFCKCIRKLLMETGTAARFSNCHGRHKAVCSGGVVIVGNTKSKRIFVKWGSDHLAYAYI